VAGGSEIYPGAKERRVRWLNPKDLSGRGNIFVQSQSLGRRLVEQRRSRDLNRRRRESRLGLRRRPIQGGLFKPWDIPSPEHPQLGPVTLIDHDLYAPVRLRGSARLHEPISFFDLSPLSEPGFSFWADWASLWHRLPGRFCICEQGTIIWGERNAPLELLRPA
jgi:hypothetical protein